MPPRRSTASAQAEVKLPKTPGGVKKTPSGQFTPITSKSSTNSETEGADLDPGQKMQDGESDASSSVRVLGGRSRARGRITPASKNKDQRGMLTPPSIGGSLRREVSVEVPGFGGRMSGRGKKASVVEISETEDEKMDAEDDEEEPAVKSKPASRKRKVSSDEDDFASPMASSSNVKPKPKATIKKPRTSTTSSRPSRAAKLTPVKYKHTKAELFSDASLSDPADSEDGSKKMGGRGTTDRSTSKGFSEFEGDVDALLSDEDDDGLADTRISKHSEVKLHRVENGDLGVKEKKVAAPKGGKRSEIAIKGKSKPRGRGAVKDEEDVDMLAASDEEEEDFMLQAAIEASLGIAKPNGKTKKKGESKNAVASGSGSGAKVKVKKEDGRSKMAEKMARAAERRSGKVVDSPPASDEDSSDDPDFGSEAGSAASDSFDGSDASSSGGGGSIAKKGKGKAKAFPSGIKPAEDATMTVSMKAARAEEKVIKKAYQARVLAARKALIKKLGRGLTQGEKNGVSLGLHHPELADVWGDVEANIEIVTPVPMEADPRLRLTLMPFQKESLYWMKKQEEGMWKGGMLADEMGMGKTIQTIALLLSEPRKKPSLVVAPVVALSQWKREIETHAEGFSVCLWHGSGRMKAQELKKYDVVLVSYGTLEASFRKQQKGFKRGNVMVTEKSPMHSFKWFRIVLDEAHNIKERSTNVSKAAFALDAEYRWCLSGTPLQNRVGELYSLVRFLGGDPFAFYFCKLCDCKSLHWSFLNRRNCEQCNHSPMQHLCFWNNEILTPIQKYGMAGPGQFAFKKLKILLDRMMLRRTKLERADDLGLPPRVITIRRDYFSPQEKELYQSLFMETKRQFSSYVEEGTVLNKYSSIFTLITRMRQMSCHPDLVLRSKNAQYIQGMETEVVCRLCNDSVEDAIISKCNHVFDRECIRQYLEACAGEGIPDCPVCHVSISIDLEDASIDDSADKRVTKRQGILGRMDLENWRSSTKVEAVVEVLSDQRNRDCTIKTIIFSQFVSFLDIIAFRLQRAGFNICRIEGGMSLQARDATIQHYMKNPAVTVMLISLRAGGVALNLTEASTVIMADSWWNPSVEYQAFDRVHRFGQRRPVNVIKLVIEDSIESKIVQLQEKKLLMTEAALSKDPDAAAGKLSIEDLQFLFKM